MTIDQAIGMLEQDQRRHLTADRPSERDLDVIEEALGSKLTEDFRTLLARLGGGILYERHEVFGAHRLMVHDIELVPDLVSFREHFARRGSLADGLVPFHRADGVVNLLDVRDGAVISEDGARSYSSLSSFLEKAVLSRERGSAALEASGGQGPACPGASCTP
jgi:hypothetical protein